MVRSHVLKAGIPVSLSGQFRVQGEQALAGLQAWVEYANSSGGIRLGPNTAPRPVTVVHYDDASKAEEARLVTERLIDKDRVDLLFGPYSAALTDAAAEVSESYGRLLWNQGGASDSVYRKGYRLVVGILTPATEYLTGLLPLVRGVDPEAESLAVLRASTGGFPRAVSFGVERHAEGLGFRLDMLREFPASITNFKTILEELAQSEPDVLLCVGRIGNDLLLASQLVGMGFPLKAVAVVATPIQQFRDLLGRSVEGFVGPSQWEISGSYSHDYGPGAREVVNVLARQSTYPVDYPMVQAFAAGLAAQKCLEEAATLEDNKLRELAGRLEFSTFYGKFRIDPDTGRQTGRSVVLVQWQEGMKVIVWPPEQAQGPLLYPWHLSQTGRP